jgi:hypothetical protein
VAGHKKERDPLRTKPSTKEFMKPTEKNLTNWKGAVLGMKVLCGGPSITNRK